MMIHRLLACLLLLLGACDSSAALQNSPVDTPPAPKPVLAENLSTEQKERLTRLISDWADTAEHGGISLSVASPSGDTWSIARGMADDENELTPSHLIAVASITKTVTGALILQLSAEGRFDLDNPIGRWFPDRPGIEGGVTIRQLLNHTSGLANYTSSPRFAPSVNSDPNRVFSAEEIIDEFIGEPVFAPGEHTQYANTNILLLGRIAEMETGRPLAELFRERFWTPLELEEVFLPFMEQARGPVAQGWLPLGNGSVTRNSPMDFASLYSAAWSAFGLMASTRNMAVWGHALFAGDVLDEALRREMTTFVPSPGILDVETGTGLGIRGYEFNGAEQWGHSGAAPHGSSLMVYDPASGYTLVLAMNMSPRLHRNSHFNLMGELLAVVSPTG